MLLGLRSPTVHVDKEKQQLGITPEAYALTQILCLGLGVAILMHLGYYPEAGATLAKWSKQVAVAHTALSMNDMREVLATGKLLKIFDLCRWHQ